jgi:hypothetical protein
MVNIGIVLGRKLINLVWDSRRELVVIQALKREACDGPL